MLMDGMGICIGGFKRGGGGGSRHKSHPVERTRKKSIHFYRGLVTQRGRICFKLQQKAFGSSSKLLFYVTFRHKWSFK